MRTTIDIDEHLLESVLKATGQTVKSSAVNEALACYLRDQGIRRLLDLQGKLDLDLDDWYEFRHSEKRMMEPVILDTSVWLQYFRAGNSQEARVVRSLLEINAVMLVGTVYAELLRGARTREQFEALTENLNVLPYAEVNKETWRLTGEILSSLEQSGNGIPLPDALIAAVALQNDLSVYTRDGHFSRVSNLRLYQISS